LVPDADREVRGVRGIAHQHDRHPAVGSRAPSVWQITRGKRIHWAEPRRWRGVADQRVAVEVRWRTACSQNAMPSCWLMSGQAMRCHTVFGRLDDEGGGVGVELVGVGLEPAVLGLLEGEGEGVERLVRAQPDEAAVAQCRCRAE
jgi:hypothetical protein